MLTPLARRALAPAVVSLSLLLAACSGGSANGPGSAGGGSGGSNSAAGWKTYERTEDYPSVVQLAEQKIAMSDGVQLSVKVALPADANGAAVATPLPVLLTQTGYNKSIPAIPAYNEFLVRHGYAHVSVDVRGTGASGGNWEAFSAREQQDYREVMDWVASQPWSNGRVGTWGASFMGITQIFTAAHQHPAHQAAFAIVPMGDAYRDIVFAGGQVNVGFIPLWMGLVTGLGVIPADPSAQSPQIIAEHVVNAVAGFQVPTIAAAAVGTDGKNYDSEFWRTRSPIEVADRVRVPTFIVGGLHDIFQRGEPMLYEVIKRSNSTKLLIGPWTHIDASSGAGLPADGVPDLDHLALAWFDQYLKGMDTGAAAMPQVTQYVAGHGHYVTATDWPHPQAQPQRWFLRGDKSLDTAPPAAEEPSQMTLPIPVAGICSVSTAQWTAGAAGLLPLPCFQGDDTLNELPLVGAVTWTTAPMAQDYYINGPIQADLWISSAMSDAGIAVRITDVDAGGTSTELSNGILTASQRLVEPARSRYLGGQMVQPWHPYTAAAAQPLVAGEPALASVEIFPTSVVIKQGHSLRIAVSTADFPHGLPPVTDLLDQLLGVLTIHSDPAHPSSLVVPVVPVSAIP